LHCNFDSILEIISVGLENFLPEILVEQPIMLYSFLYVSRRCLPLDGGDLDIHIVSSVKEVKHNIQVQWNMHHLINFVVGR
jgi:hypothetical protein